MKKQKAVLFYETPCKFRVVDTSLALGPCWWFWASCCIFWELKLGERFGLKTKSGAPAFSHILAILLVSETAERWRWKRVLLMMTSRTNCGDEALHCAIFPYPHCDMRTGPVARGFL